MPSIRRPVEPLDAEWHGNAESDVGYTNHKCGCQRCLDAHAEWNRRWRNKDKPIPAHIDPDSYNAYKYYKSRTPGAIAANNAEKVRQAANRKRQNA